MGTRPLSILLIEDSLTDAQVLQEVLDKDQDGPFELQTTATLAQALTCLQAGGVDVILLDLHLPDSKGLNTLAAVKQRAPMKWRSSIHACAGVLAVCDGESIRQSGRVCPDWFGVPT